MAENAKKKEDAKANGKGPPSTNVDRETFLNAVSTMVDFNNKLANIKSERNSARKRIKAQGIELSHLDAIIKMGEWSREEVRSWFDTQRIYAEFYNLPVGSQPELFADMDDDQISIHEWEQMGVTAGLAGKDNKPPEHCPAEFHQAFVRGWRKGQDQLASAMFEAPADDAAQKTSEKAAPKGDVSPEEAKRQIREYADGKAGTKAKTKAKKAAEPAGATA